MTTKTTNYLLVLFLATGLAACTGQPVPDGVPDNQNSSSSVASTSVELSSSNVISSSSVATSSSVSSSLSSASVISSSSTSVAPSSSSVASSSSISLGTFKRGDLLSVDQCDSTNQCQALFGDQADDCSNSGSDQSICLCGRDSCAETFDAHTLTYAINAGGGSYTDSQGIKYSKDFGFNNDSTVRNTPNISVANTPDEPLYQAQRHAETLEYNLPVTNGIYDVTVKLADNKFRENGQRIFNLMAEGNVIATNLDMFARFGREAKDITLRDLRVSDGKLTIASERIVNEASIAGIVITSVNGRGTCDEACKEGLRGATATPETPNGDLVHPGMLSTQAQLNLMKTRFKNGHRLTVEQVDLMRDHVNRFTKIRNPRTQNSAAGGGNFIYCGSFNKGRDGTTTVAACNWPAEDGVTAYTHALLGFITNDASHSKKAIAFIESWANENNFKGFDPEGSNAHLQHGWIIPWFANAAEILRYTSSEWEAKHTRQMDSFIKRMMKLVTADANLPSNNWLHARIEAHIASAIWLDDKVMLNAAVARWKKMTRSYIYIDKDNNDPVAPPPTNLTEKSRKTRIWAVNKYIEGGSMETCRDINHESLGIRAIINSMTMASAQKIDLLSGNDNRERLVAFFEFMPKLVKKVQDANAILSNSRSTQAQKDKALKDAKNPFGLCKASIKNRPNVEFRLDPKPRLYPMAYSLLSNNKTPLRAFGDTLKNAESVQGSRWLVKWETLLASTLEPIP